jgi:amino acid permease
MRRLAKAPGSNAAMAEMRVHMPVSGGVICLASKWVGAGFGLMAGINFFLYEVHGWGMKASWELAVAILPGNPTNVVAETM